MEGEEYMELRMFYQKLRNIEQSISEPHVVVVSLETPDGGKAGVKTEVERGAAAKLIVEGRARLASADETKEHYEAVQAATKAREAEVLTRRLSVNIVSDEELAVLRRIKGKQER
jgi:hypothetical protein